MFPAFFFIVYEHVFAYGDCFFIPVCSHMIEDLWDGKIEKKLLYTQVYFIEFYFYLAKNFSLKNKISRNPPLHIC